MDIVMLQILKGLFTVLMILFFSFLAFLILILIIPINYNAEGKVNEKSYSFYLTISWIFSIVRFTLSFDQEASADVRIFGKKIGNKEKNKREHKRTVTKKIRKEETREEVKEKMNKVPSDHDQQSTHEQNTGQDSGSSDPSEVKKTKKSNSIHKESLIAKVQKIIEKKEELFLKIDAFLLFLKYDETVITLQRLKKKFCKVFRSLLPRKFYLKGTAGFKEPSLTGEIMGLLAMMYPITGNKVDIVFDFSEEILILEGKAKGKIRWITLFYQLLTLCLNRHFIQMIKMLKKEVNKWK